MIPLFLAILKFCSTIYLFNIYKKIANNIEIIYNSNNPEMSPLMRAPAQCANKNQSIAYS